MRAFFATTLFLLILVIVPTSAYAQTPRSGVEGVCSARPWANSVISFLLPDGLFDGLCSVWGFGTPGAVSLARKNDALSFNTLSLSRGISCPVYAEPNLPITLSWSCGRDATLAAVAGFSVSKAAVGRTSVIPTKASQVYGIRCSDGYESVCTVRTIDPKVEIWAEPELVRLGSRTNIFWDSQDTLNCRINGPSFEEVGIRGGASTVPITTASTFTAVCITESDETISASVTVDFTR